MTRSLRGGVCGALIVLAAMSPPVHAGRPDLLERFGAIDAEIDLRLVAADSPLASFTEGGLGALRFDEEHDGVRLGRLIVEYRAQPLDTLSANVTLLAYGDDDKNPLDVTEAFVEWRPVPRSILRTRARLGAFYPPVSLENRGVGWQSLYSISSSAINTWLGEEVRAIGAQVEVMAMGAPAQRPFDAGLVAGVFAWNDPLGVLIFERGWALHDRQTTLLGRLPKLFAAGTTRHGLELFHEIDDRPGFYVGGELRERAIVLRALHYDNRGDPAATNGRENAWLTRFNSAGLRTELPMDITVIVQWLSGDTSVGGSQDGRGFLITDFEARFLLVSKALGRHRFTARFDDFETQSVRNREIFDSAQDGNAWLLAYLFDYDEHWRLAAEALNIDSTLAPRITLGQSAQATERLYQVAIAYRF